MKNKYDNHFSFIHYLIVFLLFSFAVVIILKSTPDKYETIKITATSSDTVSDYIIGDDNILEVCLYTNDGIVIKKTYNVNEKIITGEQETDIFIYNNLIPETTYYVKSSIYNSKNVLIKENYDISFIPTKEDVYIEISYIG